MMIGWIIFFAWLELYSAGIAAAAKRNGAKNYLIYLVPFAGYGKVFVESHKEIRSVGFEIIDKTNRCNKFSYEWDRGGDFCGEFFIEMPILWSLSNPYLYGYKAEIKYLDGEISVKEGKFGFRTLGQNSKNITINGKDTYTNLK